MGDNKKIKTIAISGASGFIGSHMSGYLLSEGYQVLPLSRSHFTDEGAVELDALISKADAVVNLAGAPINHRWTPEYKKQLYHSRIDTTRRIVDAIRRSGDTGKVLCSASAVGYYTSEPPDCNTETENRPGTGYLSLLCKAWEAEAMKAAGFARVAVMRFGLVLSPDGGVMPLMSLPARLKFATVSGSGGQFFPWIDLQDLLRATEFIIKSDGLKGVFNFVAPQTISNRQFAHSMARAKRSWFTVKVPRFVFEMVLGEAASTVLSGQCVIPQRLLESGFRFISPDIDQFFERDAKMR